LDLDFDANQRLQTWLSLETRGYKVRIAINNEKNVHIKHTFQVYINRGTDIEHLSRETSYLSGQPVATYSPKFELIFWH
jgi:hypothetical protein